MKKLIILLAIVVGLATATGWDAVSNQPVTKQFEGDRNREGCYDDVIGDCYPD